MTRQILIVVAIILMLGYACACVSPRALCERDYITDDANCRATLLALALGTAAGTADQNGPAYTAALCLNSEMKRRNCMEASNIPFINF